MGQAIPCDMASRIGMNHSKMAQVLVPLLCSEVLAFLQPVGETWVELRLLTLECTIPDHCGFEEMNQWMEGSLPLNTYVTFTSKQI